MGLISSFMRFLVSIVVFVAALILGIIYAPQLTQAFGSLPGTFTISSGNSTVVVPLLASILASVVISLVLNLAALPFRRAE